MVFRDVVMAVAEATILTGFAASTCWTARNVVKDPSSNTIMNFLIFATVFTGRIGLKKNVPDN